MAVVETHVRQSVKAQLLKCDMLKGDMLKYHAVDKLC